MRPPLSVVLMVKDEEDRLGDALASVSWADEVVVVDTGSADGTVSLARRHGARVVAVPWEGYVRSRNRSLAEAKHDWVLFLDADERVTPALRGEIESRLAGAEAAGVAGFTTPRLSYLFDRPVRHGTWYPDEKLRLARRTSGFRCEGGRVHERLAVDGRVEALAEPLVHVPYRDLADALRKAVSYARLGADDRFERGERAGLASYVFRPAFEFFRCYAFKRGALDGAVGLWVAALHAASYLLRAAFLGERARLERTRRPAAPAPADATPVSAPASDGRREGADPMRNHAESLVRPLAAALGLALALGGAGCSKKEPDLLEGAAKKMREKAKEQQREVDEAAKKARENLAKAHEHAEETSDALQDKSPATEDEAREAVEKAREAAKQKVKRAVPFGNRPPTPTPFQLEK